MYRILIQNFKNRQNILILRFENISFDTRDQYN